MPTRRILSRIAAACVAAACVTALVAAGTSHDSAGQAAAHQRALLPSELARPRLAHGANIVFVLTDDLTTNLLPYMPHVQALERAGTSFLNYFVVDSLCCPSRATIFTGNYPHNTGVLYNAGPRGGYRQFIRRGNNPKSFGPILQAAGYRTGFMGKYLNRYPPKAGPAPGWDEWDVTGNEGYPEYDYHLNENGKVRFYGHRPADYLTNVISRKAVRFIDESAKGRRPFALEVATYAPHSPAKPAPSDVGSFPGLQAPRGLEWNRLPNNPPSWLAKYPPLSAADRRLDESLYRRRVESVQAVDRMIGRLEQELGRRGLLDNTYFVFSSDNGFHLGERRMAAGKQTAYDTDVRVPLIVAGPGVPANRQDDTLMSSIDLAPTFEQIASTRSPFRQDGSSALDIWHGLPAPASWSRAILIEHRLSQLPGDPDYQSGHSGLAPSYEALRTKDYLYVEYRNGDREYYDLREDPDELNNIVDVLPIGRILVLHRLLASLQACHGQSCRTHALAAG